jgi:hypothetical protein
MADTVETGAEEELSDYIPDDTDKRLPKMKTGQGRAAGYPLSPSSLAMIMRWTSEVPSPISSTLASR